jgi:hypothetical protein
MLFHERWITDSQLLATAGLAASTDDLVGEVIEIGVWQGLSAITIANAVYPATLHAVDHWRGDEGDVIGTPPELLSRDNYGIFLANVAEGTKGNVKVWKMGWREFAAQWDQPIRFLHLDASHGAGEVAGNIEALLPWAVPGAIFCGDDYGRGGVTEGVHRHFEAVDSREALWWVTIEPGG